MADRRKPGETVDTKSAELLAEVMRAAQRVGLLDDTELIAVTVNKKGKGVCVMASFDMDEGVNRQVAAAILKAAGETMLNQAPVQSRSYNL